MNSKLEQLRADALLLALKEVEEGPLLAARVRSAQETLLAAAAPPKHRKARAKRPSSKNWIEITAEEIEAMTLALDGLSSSSRHLFVSRTTIRAWRIRGRIPMKYLEKWRELIATNAPSMRRPRNPNHIICP